MTTATATKQADHYIVTEYYDFGYDASETYVVESLQDALELRDMAGTTEDGVQVRITVVFTDGTVQVH